MTIAVLGAGAFGTALAISLAQRGPVLLWARDAAHVTMLQRSPTWMISRPAEDRVANFLRRILPPMTAYNLVRWRNVLFQNFFFKQTRKNPQKVNKRVTDMLLKELPEDVVKAHFQPSYNVWDQRLCLVPDEDLFEAIRNKKADVVTGHIDRAMTLIGRSSRRRSRDWRR